MKLAAEQLVRESAVPWSIVRATGFYWLLERPIVLCPRDVHMQPVDSDEFADFVVAALADGPRHEREDFVGPETLTMRELAEQYLAARGLRRRIWNAPLPRSVRQALEAGNTSPEARQRVATWSEWLRRSRTVSPAAASLAA